MITETDEKKYNLKPLPEISFPGRDVCMILNDRYSAARRKYTSQNPPRYLKSE